jgi:hypothetical protein
MMKKLWHIIKIILICAACVVLLTQSTLLVSEKVEQVRAFTRGLEFDYVNWTVDALFSKNQTAALKPELYLSDQQAQDILNQYFTQVDEINSVRGQINQIYSDPDIQRPELAAADALEKLKILEQENDRFAQLSEAVLEQQISMAAAELGLSLGGQLVPPLMYHVTPLPMALIVSPRDIIRQDADISLQADLTLEEVVNLEDDVEQNLNVSALVVNIGGVGIYPTMVLRTTNLPWMIETIAHEWTHNFLTLRPLGMLYNETPELRTMNETTASLAGKEIALMVYKLYYPQFLPDETAEASPSPAVEETKPEFDFRAEMHTTRVIADQLLADGKIEEAEAYMENRRVIFWDHGYRIRKLNQAYFAFYGAYADVPGGAAGEDPVGPAVRTLRQQSKSLAAFLNQISWMTSFDSLKAAVSSTP